MLFFLFFFACLLSLIIEPAGSYYLCDIFGIGTAIGAGISSAGSVAAQREANKANIQIAREANALNYKMFNEGNEFNKSEREAAQEWDSAINQRARLEAAGLNPYLMMDGGNAGTAQAATSASPPAAEAPTVQPAFFDAGKILQDTMQAMLGEQELKMREKQMQGFELDNEAKRIENAFAAHALKGRQTMFDNELARDEYDTTLYNTDRYHQSKRLEYELSQKKSEMLIKEVEQQFAGKFKSAELKKLKGEIDNLAKSSKLLSEQALTEEASRIGYKILASMLEGAGLSNNRVKSITKSFVDVLKSVFF